MPRVAINRHKYLLNDLISNIEGKRKGHKLTQTDVGLKLGISQQAYSQHIKDKTFGYNELLTLFDELDFSNAEILRTFGRKAEDDERIYH